MIEIVLIFIGCAVLIGVVVGEIAARVLGMPRRSWGIGTPYAKSVKRDSGDGSMAEVPCARTQMRSRGSKRSRMAPRVAYTRKITFREYLTKLFFTKKSPQKPNAKVDANLTQIGRKYDANRTQKDAYTKTFSANDLPYLCVACSGAFGMSRIVSPERCEACKPKRFLPPQLKLVSSESYAKSAATSSETRGKPVETRRVPAREPPSNTTRLVARKEKQIEKRIDRACYKIQVDTKRQLQTALEYRIEQVRRDLSSKKSLTKVVSKDTIEQMGFRLQELEHLRSFVKNSVLYKRGSWK